MKVLLLAIAAAALFNALTHVARADLTSTPISPSVITSPL